jgi:hypothetical protein
MNLNFLVGKRGNDLTMNVTILTMLECCNLPNPVDTLRARFGIVNPDSHIQFLAGNSASTNTLVLDDDPQLLVLIGGATSAAQIVTLTAGIESGPDPRDNVGAVRTFYQAARNLASQLFGSGGYAGRNLTIAGHSFGGGVAAALGVYLLSLGQANRIQIITYGAPRSGGPAFAERLSRNDHTRFWNDQDIVPWLPPHANEVPSLYLVSPISLARGCNQLCHAPSGYGLRGTGVIDPTMGNPPDDWTLILSLYSYMTSAMVGVQAPNHGISVYLDRMRRALATYPAPIPRPAEIAQVPLIQRPRERNATIAIGRAEVFADATSPTGQTRSYVVPTVTDPAAPRYKAAKDGSVWVIKLAGIICGSATGKRAAKRIARSWNRSARATLPT